MKDLLIYVTVGHYGEYDDYTTNTEYVGTSKDKAIDIIKTLDYDSNWGVPFVRAHVEVWKDETQIRNYDGEGKITWDLAMPLTENPYQIPDINDFKLNGGNTILFGDYVKACKEKSKEIQENSDEKIEFPDINVFLDGDGFVKDNNYKIEIEKHFKNLIKN